MRPKLGQEPSIGKKALTTKKTEFKDLIGKSHHLKIIGLLLNLTMSYLKPDLTMPHLRIKKLHRYFNDLSDSHSASFYCLINVDGPLSAVPLK